MQDSLFYHKKPLNQKPLENQILEESITCALLIIGY